MMRKATVERKTTETDIKLSLEIDGTGKYDVKTGVGFFDHMLELFIRHAQFDCKAVCNGDIHVDAHHTVEDVGIVFGLALKEAMGTKEGITRYGEISMPMDEALINVSMDISGRPFFVYNVQMDKMKTGDFDAELCEEFFRSLSFNAGITMHINLLYGTNTHHIIEGVFKGVAHAIKNALKIDPEIKGVLSTKGVL